MTSSKQQNAGRRQPPASSDADPFEKLPSDQLTLLGYHSHLLRGMVMLLQAPTSSQAGKPRFHKGKGAMTAMTPDICIRRRHRDGMHRLRLRKRSYRDAILSISNPPRSGGLDHAHLDHHVPISLSASDIKLAIPSLPSEALPGGGVVDTREVAAWLEEHGDEEAKHAWQWWQVEALAGTWKRGYGLVDSWEDYRDWCRLSA